jgi:hypothetical protein
MSSCARYAGRLAKGHNHQFMRDDETDLEHILRLNVGWRRHAGQTSLRGWILDRCRLGSQAVSQDFCESFLETMELVVFR